MHLLTGVSQDPYPGCLCAIQFVPTVHILLIIVSFFWNFQNNFFTWKFTPRYMDVYFKRKWFCLHRFGSHCTLVMQNIFPLISSLLIFMFKLRIILDFKSILPQAPVTHTCNPSYIGCWDWEYHSLSPAQGNISGDSNLQNINREKWVWSKQ
jgi:hypothetical protein